MNSFTLGDSGMSKLVLIGVKFSLFLNYWPIKFIDIFLEQPGDIVKNFAPTKMFAKDLTK